MAKQVAVLLVDDFADWELGSALPAVRLWFGAEIITASLDGGPVRSMGGLLVQADRRLSDLSPEATDLWILPGSDLWGRGPIHAVTEALHRRASASKPIAASCGATLALAHAGLLDDRPHTSNSLDFLVDNVPNYQGMLYYQDRPCVRDGMLITAAGSAPVSFAAEICREIAPHEEEAITTFQREFAREHD
jgi:putative intracellular protease/amidase